MYRMREINMEGEFQSYARTLVEARALFEYLSKFSDNVEVLNEAGEVLYKHQKQYPLLVVSQSLAEPNNICNRLIYGCLLSQITVIIGS